VDADVSAPDIAHTAYEFTGVLVDHGEARQKSIDREGHLVPVLILNIQSDSLLRTPLHIEQPFPAGHMDQAEAAARRYRKGQRITVHAPVTSLRMAVTASHIHVDQPEPTTEEDLFS
jgi:hypothetical protein